MSSMQEPTPGMLPAEGRDDLGPDAAERGPGNPPDRTEAPLGGPAQQLRDIAEDPTGTDRRDELADRVGVGMPSPAGGTESDLLPDTEVPEGRM